MPEIAEVETVRLGLLPLKGQVLKEIEAEDKFFLPEILLGQKLEDVKRHGKLLGFYFEDSVVSAHLRMTGKFLYRDAKHRRARLRFSRDELFFVDPRGFGTLNLTEEWPGDLGPDIWQSPRFIPKTESRRAIKAFILDQKQVAGIGNYLADESLFAAGIHPETPAKNLSPDDWRRLLGAARKLSKKVLSLGGVSLRDYKNTEDLEGLGEELLQIYGHGGEPCPICSQILIKTRFAGRGTVLCSVCQPILPER